MKHSLFFALPLNRLGSVSPTWAWQAMNVCGVFCVTMAIFPGVLVHWLPLAASSFRNSKQLYGNILIGCFQVKDGISGFLFWAFTLGLGDCFSLIPTATKIGQDLSNQFGNCWDLWGKLDRNAPAICITPQPAGRWRSGTNHDRAPGETHWSFETVDPGTFASWQWHCQICNLLSWTSLGGCASQLASGLRCIYNWDQLGVHMDIPDLTELYWIIIYLLYGYISSYVAQVLVSKFLVPWRTPK